MSKRSGKKYNPNKGIEASRRLEETTTRAYSVKQAKKLNIGVIYVEGMNESRAAQIIDMSDLNIYSPTTKVSLLFAGVSHRWYHTLFTACRDQQGNQYITSFTPVFKDEEGNEIKPLLHSTEIAQHLESVHKHFNKTSINPLHIVTTGWITFTYSREVDEEVLYDIITKLGLWEFSTKWEYDTQNKLE